MTAPHRLPAATLSRTGAVTMPKPSPEQVARETAQVEMLRRVIEAINCRCGKPSVYFNGVGWSCADCWGDK